MKLPNRLRLFLLARVRAVMASRPPDFIVGHAADPYLHRWRVFPRNALGNIYLHRFFRDDDDRALHDHPYHNLSIVLEHGYYEHLSHGWECERAPFRYPGWVGARRANTPHRVVTMDGKPPVSIFLHGPRVRAWGFHCLKGWVPWQVFHGMNNTKDPNDSGGHQSGKGCG